MLRSTVIILLSFGSLIILLTVGSPVATASGFDLSLAGSYRSYALAGGAEMAMGYGHLIWGDKKKPLYGFVRVATGLEGVEDYIASTVKVEIFPISLLGVRVGQSWIQNHLDYEDFDCVTYLCRGQFSYDFVEVPFYMGWKRILLSASYRISRWERDRREPVGSRTHYIEPSSGLGLSLVESEDVERWRGALLYEFNSYWRIGYSYVDDRVSQGPDELEQRTSQMWLGLIQYHKSKLESTLSVFVGAGEYRSYLLNPEPSYVLGFELSLWPRLGY